MQQLCLTLSDFRNLTGLGAVVKWSVTGFHFITPCAVTGRSVGTANQRISGKGQRPDMYNMGRRETESYEIEPENLPSPISESLHRLGLSISAFTFMPINQLLRVVTIDIDVTENLTYIKSRISNIGTTLHTFRGYL